MATQGKEKTVSVYDIITDEIVKALESGNVPWRKPWNVRTNGPRNIDGRPYNGMNVFLLLARGHQSSYWLTRKQIDERGGTIRAGEEYNFARVIFWKINKYKKKDDITGQTMIKTVPLLLYYKVYNLEQVEGINPPKTDDAKSVLDFSPIEAAEKIVANYTNGPAIHHGGNGAFFRPALDDITMPDRESFESVDEYYSTLFHEMTHSTGVKSRLDRHTEKDQFVFGSHSYGREELVAEMGSAFLCGESGILPQTLENSTAYISGWLRAIKEDRKAVVVAASRAQKAADYILGKPGPNYDDHDQE